MQILHEAHCKLLISVWHEILLNDIKSCIPCYCVESLAAQVHNDDHSGGLENIPLISLIIMI